MTTNEEHNQTESPSDFLDQKNVKLVRSTFKTVWTEFYAWEQVYSQDAIDSLAIPLPAPIATSSFESLQISEPSRNKPGLRRSAGETLTVSDCSSSRPRHERISVETIICDAFDPYPPYESCTPCTTSIFHGDDVDDMPFIPYADDPDFDIVDHMGEYPRLEWQDKQKNVQDPDWEDIMIETVSRLHFIHKIPYVDIDATDILLQPIFPRPGTAGILRGSRQRDLLKWSGITATEDIPRAVLNLPEATDLRSRFENSAIIFCANLNCIKFCWRHFEPVPVPYHRVLTAPNSKGPNTPCGNACFLVNGNVHEPMTPWSPSDEETLRCIIDITPGLKSCELAIICLKPCREVHIRSQNMAQNAPSPLRSGRKLPPQDNLSYNEFCRHTGSCSGNDKCSCFRNRVSCNRQCMCDDKCKRRRGCRCKTDSRMDNSCSTRLCPCYRARRECHPELCVKCNVRCGCFEHWAFMIITEPPETAPQTCVEMPPCSGAVENVEVKKSNWGLGLFLTEPARQGDLIAEYIGEVILEPTVLSRDALATHRRRNYLFSLGTDLSLDSTHAGNDTRYINHAETEKANCLPMVVEVNGDFRIGIYARTNLQAGEEVTINYGPDFFRTRT